MRTSFHHQPEAQHPNFPLSTSGQADYPIFRSRAARGGSHPWLSLSALRYLRLTYAGRYIARRKDEI